MFFCALTQNSWHNLADVCYRPFMHTTETPTGGEHLKSSEVIALAAISRRTLERWVADGTLPAVKVGGTRRYKRSDVEALLRGERAA